MTIQEMKDRKKALGLTNRELAEKAGIPVSTVAKVLGGTTGSPRIDTVRALEAVLCPTPSNEKEKLSDSIRQEGTAEEPGGSYIYGSNAEQGMTEQMSSFSEQKNGDGGSHDRDFLHDNGYGGYEIRVENECRELEIIERRTNHFREQLHTIEDYLALPDERRVEMIDGRFYDMAAPSGIHQQIVMRLWKTLDNCIEEHGMPCVAQAAPFDVQLDDHTIVQPDVMVFCGDPSQAFAVRATTPPDLVIEVLSKSTAFKDRHLKLFKYQRAGVKELWLVAPEKQSVEVYLFVEGKEEPERYTFEDKISVYISDDRCVVDFGDIRRRISGFT